MAPGTPLLKACVMTSLAPVLQRHPVAVRAALILWAAFLCLVCSTFLGSHLVPLPQPERDDAALAAAIAEHRRVQDSGRWMVMHVLYGECPCSRKIAETLLDPERPRPEGLSETVLFIGEDRTWAERSLAAGFRVEELSHEELKAQWHVEAAPLLVVADPYGEVRYVGGYTSRKQGPDVRDIAIIEDLQGDTPVEVLPLFGCAVSQALQSAVDPFGLR